MSKRNNKMVTVGPNEGEEKREEIMLAWKQDPVMQSKGSHCCILDAILREVRYPGRFKQGRDTV